MALNSLKDLLSDNKALSVLKLDGVEFKDLRFPNQESYRGGWRDARVRWQSCLSASQLLGTAGGCWVLHAAAAVCTRHFFTLQTMPLHGAACASACRPLRLLTPLAAQPTHPHPQPPAAGGRGLLHLGGWQHVRGRVARGPQARLGHLPLAQRRLVLWRVARRLHAGAQAAGSPAGVCSLPGRLCAAAGAG